MAKNNEETPAKSGGGCIGLLTKGFLAVTILGMIVALAFVYLPQDVSGIEGVGPAAVSAPKKDIKAMLRSSLERGYEVSFTEEEINGYLSRTLASKQEGLLGGNATIDGVWVSLEKDCAEVIIERRVFGRPFTVSTFLQVEQTMQPNGRVKTEVVLHGGPYFAGTYPYRGGRFGSLVVPQGFLRLMLPSFEKLAQAYQEELAIIPDMARIQISENRITFNPQAPGDDLGVGGSF
ncbi:hypothetical protein KBB96_13850 [Luteolibacter ambystomatis]|uniref:Uncharacterized protein n=1 Tax=Luteolibacter ambystomatis TaxID=2824561 RepID=A0A975IYB0_9BACT|nr:hypothetical protein [Luteolibacter ambystomatis]QUE49949.1 hypothetical protein KBB96_13850 [Luteolibacter ambystomatis]